MNTIISFLKKLNYIELNLNCIFVRISFINVEKKNQKKLFHKKIILIKFLKNKTKTKKIFRYLINFNY